MMCDDVNGLVTKAILSSSSGSGQANCRLDLEVRCYVDNCWLWLAAAGDQIMLAGMADMTVCHRADHAVLKPSLDVDL